MTNNRRIRSSRPRSAAIYALRSGSGEAIAHLSRAIDLGCTAGPAFEDLAEALSRTGRLDEAVAVLQRGIALEPYRPGLQKSLVLRHIQLKRYSDARSAMQRYLELFPEDSFMRGLLQKAERPQ